MAAVCSRAAEPGLVRPPIRIRTVLLAAVAAFALWWCYDRAVAAWRLHAMAAALANYGLCMVGPTGPSLLRDNISEFQRLVRRRLISALADERLFGSCAPFAGEVTGSPMVERVHTAMASQFVEYGAAPRTADKLEAWSLGDLGVSTRPLADLAHHAWPFVSGGYTRLVKASSRAREALHPVALPKPAQGRGLPEWRARYRAVRQSGDDFFLAVGSGANLAAYRTGDGGVTWRRVARSRALDSFAERCAGPDGQRIFTFELSSDGATTLVVSDQPGRAARRVPLAPSDHEVFAAACDDAAIVAATKADRSASVTLHWCGHRGPCRHMHAPQLSGAPRALEYPLDIARVDGTTIVAVAMQGLVRVASSRDDGETWTPFSVAFDPASDPNSSINGKIADRLLVLDRRVLLYGGASRASQPYPVLVSDDYGASWRTPK